MPLGGGCAKETKPCADGSPKLGFSFHLVFRAVILFFCFSLLPRNRVVVKKGRTDPFGYGPKQQGELFQCIIIPTGCLPVSFLPVGQRFRMGGLQGGRQSRHRYRRRHRRRFPPGILPEGKPSDRRFSPSTLLILLCVPESIAGLHLG